MTKEEINKRIMQACRNTWNEKVCKEIEEALEQESCEDAISRQYVIEKLNGINGTAELDKLFEIVENAPPVTPKGVTVTDFADKCRECGREKVLDKIRAEIEAIEDGISSYHNDRPWIFKDEALAIIDKYKAEMESEE